MTKQPGKATITDVARLAEVSLSTVSRVMNGNPTVDAALGERVRAAAAELGYTASPLARSLVLGRTQTVSVVVPDLANPTFQAILAGLSHAAAADGYHVLIADSAEQVDDERPLATETRRRTDGLVLCAPRMSDAELRELLPTLAPAVVVNRAAGLGAPTVAADYAAGLLQLLTHLYAQGHRRIAYLAGSERSASQRARREALGRHDLDDLEVVVLPAGVRFDTGAAAADAVVLSGCTAVLAYNDLVAMGLLSALTERGMRVPEDIAIAGFDDIPFARYTSPPLTTAAVPADELGVQAWRAMHALLTGAEPDAETVLVPELVVRASTAV